MSVTFNNAEVTISSVIATKAEGSFTLASAQEVDNITLNINGSKVFGWAASNVIM